MSIPKKGWNSVYLINMFVIRGSKHVELLI